MPFGKCVRCRKEDVDLHSKSHCISCYKRFLWKRTAHACKRCNRELPLHAKGLCPGCYQFVFQLEYVKAHSYKKLYGLDLETYRKITSKCVICGFDKVVDLHHLDQNKKNNSETNLLGLCPNHHRMLHEYRYRAEMLALLKEKGFAVPKDIKLDYRKD